MAGRNIKMPRCRECGREITRFDRDICPYCGTPSPIEENYQTEDMTSFFSKVDGNVEDLKKAKRKRIYVLFLFLLGFAGADYFYLGFWKKGTICAVISFLLFALFSVCFYFIPGVEFLSILIGFLLILLLSFIRGFLALRKETFDVTGETLIE